MTDEQCAATVVQAERWFEQQGLPYFVHGNAERVRSALGRARLVPILALALFVGVAAGVATGLVTGDVSTGVAVGVLVLGAIVVVYALVSLHLKPI
ncbi:MAG: hypothetical protein H0T17_00330, partial [Propionibacteriales bacterium]|nr:hypothetical protein [Propionibacteriales bacterium]